MPHTLVIHVADGPCTPRPPPWLPPESLPLTTRLRKLNKSLPFFQSVGNNMFPNDSLSLALAGFQFHQLHNQEDWIRCYQKVFPNLNILRVKVERRDVRLEEEM